MPIGIGTAIGIGATVLGAGATIIASNKSASAQTHAADQAASVAQSNATANNQLARDMYAQNAARLDPYSSMGLAAGDQYMGLLVGPSSGHSSSGWAPTNALAPVSPTTTPTTPTGSALAPTVAQHAQQAIAAGADPAAVAARASQYGVAI